MKRYIRASSSMNAEQLANKIADSLESAINSYYKSDNADVDKYLAPEIAIYRNTYAPYDDYKYTQQIIIDIHDIRLKSNIAAIGDICSLVLDSFDCDYIFGESLCNLAINRNSFGSYDIIVYNRPNQITIPVGSFLWSDYYDPAIYADQYEDAHYDVWIGDRYLGKFSGVGRTNDDDWCYLNYYDSTGKLVFEGPSSDTIITLKLAKN